MTVFGLTLKRAAHFIDGFSRRSLLFFWLAGLSCVHHAWGAPVNVPVLQKIIVDGDQILFEDLIDHEKIEASQVAAELARLVIARAPLPGEERSISAEYLDVRLRQHGFDTDKIRLEAPGQIFVARSAEEVPPEKIAEIAADYVYANAPWERDRIRVKEVRQTQTVMVPAGKVSYEIQSSRTEKFLGSIPLAVRFKVGDGFEKRIWVTVEIEVMEDVVVTSRPLNRLHVLAESDLAMRRVDLTSLSGNTVTQMDMAVGKRLKRALGAHATLRMDHLERPYLVKAGDLVTIVAESKGVRITGLGRVEERGRQGDTVRVSNTDSKKDIYGEVLDSSTIRIPF